MLEQAKPGAWLETSDGVRTSVVGVCFIGRGNSNDLVLHDNRVSARHAMIQTQARDEFWLIDLGSRNGTYLNGRLINQAVLLQDGDHLDLPGFRGRFRHPRMEQRESPTINPEDKTIDQIRNLSCWLLVADIEAYTQFIQRNPAMEVAQITGNWLAECKRLVDNQGGVVNKTLGDGFLAYWLDENDALRRVAEALERLKSLQAHEEPRFRVVLHYGKVFMSGTSSPGEESLLGAEVNFTFRMEKLASSLGVHNLLSETAKNRLQIQMPTVDEYRRAIPGFEGEFVFYRY